jgi:hypothetical protein
VATATIKNFLKLRLHAFNGSGKMLFSSYRELVKPKDAARYWQIMPSAEAGEKVVAITAA